MPVRVRFADGSEFEIVEAIFRDIELVHRRGSPNWERLIREYGRLLQQQPEAPPREIFPIPAEEK